MKPDNWLLAKEAKPKTTKNKLKLPLEKVMDKEKEPHDGILINRIYHIT